jgi:hypothetical protein
MFACVADRCAIAAEVRATIRLTFNTIFITSDPQHDK